MSFWNTSAGTEATGEVQETNFDPIPKSWQPCMLETAEVDEYEGQRKIKLKARVVDGDHKNRVVFLNLKAFEGPDIKETQRDRALQLLVKLAQVTKTSLPNGEPDDRWLSKLTDKPLELYLDVWEIKTATGDSKKGNHLINVGAKGEQVGSAPSKKSAPSMAKGDIDSDIPF